jgi:hypothetical protein
MKIRRLRSDLVVVTRAFRPTLGDIARRYGSLLKVLEFAPAVMDVLALATSVARPEDSRGASARWAQDLGTIIRMPKDRRGRADHGWLNLPTSGQDKARNDA